MGRVHEIITLSFTKTWNILRFNRGEFFNKPCAISRSGVDSPFGSSARFVESQELPHFLRKDRGLQTPELTG